MDRAFAGAGKKKKAVKKTQTFDFESKEQEEAIKIIKKLPSKTIFEKPEENTTISSLIDPTKEMQKPLMQKLPSKKIIEEPEESKAKTLDPTKVLYKKPSKTITENPEESKPSKNIETSKNFLPAEEKSSQRAKATTNVNVNVMEEKKSADKSKIIPKQNDSSVKTQKISDVTSIFEKNTSGKSNEKEKDLEHPPNVGKTNKVSEFAASFEKSKQTEKEEKSALKPPIDTKVSVKDITKNLSMANLTFRLPGSPMPEKPKPQPFQEVRKIESKEYIEIDNEV